MIEIGNDNRTIGEIMGAAGTTNDHGMALLRPKPVGPTMTIDPSKVIIEEGIPLPEAKKFKVGSAWTPLLTAMEVGDSALFKGVKLAQMGYARTCAKKLNIHIAMRVREGGVRVWRVAAPEANDDGLGST